MTTKQLKNLWRKAATGKPLKVWARAEQPYAYASWWARKRANG